MKMKNLRTGHWQILVDLTTDGQQVSDLTFHAKFYDTQPPILDLQSVHVA